MTTATFFAIMLALFLGAAIMVAMYYRYRADGSSERNVKVLLASL